MNPLDLYPLKGLYHPGESVTLVAEFEAGSSDATVEFTVEFTVTEVDTTVARAVVAVPARGLVRVPWTWTPPARVGWAGFGARAAVTGVGVAHTAFDVALSWKDLPRLGFLADFGPGDSDVSVVEQLAKYHVNVVQFYDWMFRHDTLLPPHDEFVDPLGRGLSLLTIRTRVDQAHARGMTTLGYGAVYAASREFFDGHRDWAVYRNDGEPLSLGGWLYLMDVAPGTPWTRHIVEQFRRAIVEVGFDGIHLDTYGFPKQVHRLGVAPRRVENLADHYPPFVDEVRRALGTVHPDPALMFNAVNNWPGAASPRAADVTYIEVWNPHDRYRHLVGLVAAARERFARPVLLAAYLAPFATHPRSEDVYTQGDQAPYDPAAAMAAFRLLWAVVVSAGGHLFCFGEKDRVLSNNYYVDHAPLPDAASARAYADFSVRYASLLSAPELEDLTLTHSGGINQEFRFVGAPCSPEPLAGQLWTAVHSRPGWTVLSIVNLLGESNDVWNAAKSPSVPDADLEVTALIEEPVDRVWMASPEAPDARPLTFGPDAPTMRGVSIRFTVPVRGVWTLVAIRTAEGGATAVRAARG